MAVVEGNQQTIGLLMIVNSVYSLKTRSYSSVGACLWLCLTCLFFTLMGCKMIDAAKNKPLTVWIPGPAHSADTIEYDYYSHQCIFRSVIGTLVSQYQEGQITGVLAERWEVSDDFKRWVFHLRNNITFETGERITAEDIIRSWTRYAYLLKKKNSMSPLFSKLENASKIKSPDETLPGLRANGNRIMIDLTEPFPKLLETISFGLYAVVHKNDYDHGTGLWKNPKRITSSSFYKIDSWENDRITLSLRPDYLPTLRAKTAFKKAVFCWESPNISDFDIIAADSTYTMFEQSHKFRGAVTSLMYFVRIWNWDNKEHPLSQLSMRKDYRAAFYRHLEKLGCHPVRSLFPLVMTGIHEVEEDALNETNPKLPLNDFSVSIRENPEYGSRLGACITQALSNAADELGYRKKFVKATLQDIRHDMGVSPPHRKLDLAIHKTEILIEDSANDIKFMFLSKEGVCFPDVDGRIVQELNREKFSFQRINELVWEQAAIWPVGHAALGLWTKDFVDVSHLNKVLPPLDLAWIGHS